MICDQAAHILRHPVVQDDNPGLFTFLHCLWRKAHGVTPPPLAQQTAALGVLPTGAVPAPTLATT